MSDRILAYALYIDPTFGRVWSARSTEQDSHWSRMLDEELTCYPSSRKKTAKQLALNEPANGDISSSDDI